MKELELTAEMTGILVFLRTVVAELETAVAELPSGCEGEDEEVV
jgi:hypothetical protein